MKLGLVSNLEKRKNGNFIVMLNPMQGFPYWGDGGFPLTSTKFAHPHSLNFYSPLQQRFPLNNNFQVTFQKKLHF